MKNKNRKPGANTWVAKQATAMQSLFDKTAENLVWQIQHGGGSHNLHILQTIRDLEWCYLSCAAYKLALRDAIV